MGPFKFSELFLSESIATSPSIGLEALEGISLCLDILPPLSDGNRSYASHFSNMDKAAVPFTNQE